MKSVMSILMMTIVFTGVALAETLPPHTAEIRQGGVQLRESRECLFLNVCGDGRRSHRH